jgi:hypothetical protein
MLVIVLVGLVPSVAQAAPSALDGLPPGWVAEIVPLPPGSRITSPPNHSLAIDDAGYPHFSYTEVNPNHDNWCLAYAYKDEAGWHTELVDCIDGDKNGSHASSLALDRNGIPHISYLDIDKGDLRYTYKQAGEWTRLVLDDGGSYRVGWSSSLVLDKHDNPHISYIELHNSGRFRLKYIYRDTSRQWWGTRVPDVEVWYGTSLCLAEDDSPYIGYQSPYGDYVGYVTKSTSWKKHPVGIGKGVSLAVTRHGDYDFSDLHMAYMVPGEGHFDGTLEYWFNLGGAETVDANAGGASYGAMLATDNEKRPHIVYSSIMGPGYWDYGLKYAYHNSSEWVIQQWSLTSARSPGPSLAMDAQGRPHIIYSDGGVLMYAYRQSALDRNVYLPCVARGSAR